MIDTIQFNTPIGLITLYCTNEGVSKVYLGGSFSGSNSKGSESPLLNGAVNQFHEYLSGQRKTFDLPLDWGNIRGFQRDVLSVTFEIPYGNFLTYGQIAQMLNKPAASRAVGGALARNPLPILIPCHRVIASDRKLTGFSAAAGVITKKWLLELEGHRIVNQKLD
jgi:methylated-DNA-[protein]-cysteine S-methyltransferase